MNPLAKNLYPEVRRQRLLDHIRHNGQATVGELSHTFGVSEVTIRADLQHLARRNLIIRTHGGAVATEQLPQLSLNIRRQQQVLQKEVIGVAAAKQVVDGEAIFLDTSSTALAIARQLKKHRDLTIITNSLAVSQEMVDAFGVTVVMPGGILQRDTLSLIGVDGLEMLNRFNIQKGFFGAHGLNYPEGLTDVSAAEAEVKQSILQRCRRVIAVLDATKWGRAGLASFARLEDIQTIITDRLFNDELAQKARSLGIEIIIA